jgi:uncharacterized protein YndB with AHSA1/START domain
MTTEPTQTHATFVIERSYHAPLTAVWAAFADIVDQQRIVYTYDMWLDGAHASTSMTTISFEAADPGTLVTFTEQGVHLDGVHGPGPEAAAGRENGTRELLDSIETVLAGQNQHA